MIPALVTSQESYGAVMEKMVELMALHKDNKVIFPNNKLPFIQALHIGRIRTKTINDPYHSQYHVGMHDLIYSPCLEEHQFQLDLDSRTPYAQADKLLHVVFQAMQNSQSDLLSWSEVVERWFIPQCLVHGAQSSFDTWRAKKEQELLAVSLSAHMNEERGHRKM